MQPRAGTDQFVMTRPNPVRRDKSRPPVSSPRRSGRVDGFGPPGQVIRRRFGACGYADVPGRPASRYDDCKSRERESAVEYRGHLIEAFEDQPGRWFAYFRRLDSQNITGAESKYPSVQDRGGDQ